MSGNEAGTWRGWLHFVIACDSAGEGWSWRAFFPSRTPIRKFIGAHQIDAARPKLPTHLTSRARYDRWIIQTNTKSRERLQVEIAGLGVHVSCRLNLLNIRDNDRKPAQIKACVFGYVNDALDRPQSHTRPAANSLPVAINIIDLAVRIHPHCRTPHYDKLPRLGREDDVPRSRSVGF